jgi:hypothetical protein
MSEKGYTVLETIDASKSGDNSESHHPFKTEVHDNAKITCHVTDSKGPTAPTIGGRDD